MNKKVIVAMMVSVLSLPSFVYAAEDNIKGDNVVQTISEKKSETIQTSSQKETEIIPQKKWVNNQNKMTYNDLIKNVEDNNVKFVVFSEEPKDYSTVKLELNNGDKFYAPLLQRHTFIAMVENKKINFELLESFSKLETDQLKENQSPVSKVLNYIKYYSGVVFNVVAKFIGDFLYLLLIFGALYFIIIKFIMGSQGKSVSKTNPKDIDVNFSDIVGNEAAKEDITETIEFFKDDKKFKAYNLKMPSGILLTGPPGNGKTMFAKAIAKECGADFYSASGSEFEEVFAGLGAQRVRKLFKNARKSRKAVIFIDEIDSIAKKRGGFNSYHEQTLNQLLVEMDGFSSKMKDFKVLVVAATNRKDVLDEALLRPGRFDRQLVIGKPTKKDREGMIRQYIEKAQNKSNGKLVVSEDLDYSAMGSLTNGFSGAELKHLVDEALLLMIRENKEILDKDVFRKAKDKVMLGNKRNDLEMIEKERKITAYHEVGHAFASMIVSNGNRVVEGISIIPHEKALGVTFQTELRDSILRSKEDMINDLYVLVAGRAAEKVFIGSITNGASNDLQRANALAYEMFAQYGMSDKLPMLNVSHYAQNMSENTKSIIEQEISETISNCYDVIMQFMNKKSDFFHEVVRVLLDKEVIEKDEFIILCKKYQIEKLKFE